MFNKVLIASGRLTKQKDYPTLLHALHKVRRTANVGLVVLGDELGHGYAASTSSERRWRSASSA